MNTGEDLLRVEVNDGKYTVVQDCKGHLYALRHGEEWNRDLCGDNLVLSLAQEVQTLRDELARRDEEETHAGIERDLSEP